MPDARGATVMMVGEVAQLARVRQDLLESSVPVVDIGKTVPVGDIPMAGDAAPLMDPRNKFETVHGMPVYNGGDLNDSDYETPEDHDYDTWEDWCDSDIRDRYYGFPSCLLFSVPQCVGGKTWMSRYECGRTIGIRLYR